MANNPLTASLYNTPLVDTQTGLVSPEWQRWLRSQADTIAAGPNRVATVAAASAATASIGVTPIGTGTGLGTGVYRVTAYARVTTVATTSSSLAASVFFTDGGVSCTATLFTGMTGNTTATTASGSYTFRSDGGTSPISYSTTYASNAANEMAYDLVILLENCG